LSEVSALVTMTLQSNYASVFLYVCLWELQVD
jgi:hypothetical protein